MRREGMEVVVVYGDLHGGVGGCCQSAGADGRQTKLEEAGDHDRAKTQESVLAGLRLALRTCTLTERFRLSNVQRGGRWTTGRRGGLRNDRVKLIPKRVYPNSKSDGRRERE